MTSKKRTHPANNKHLIQATSRTFHQPSQTLEERFQDLQNRNRALFNTITLGIVYRDADCNLIDANPAAVEMLGMSEDGLLLQLIPGPSWHVIHPDGTELPFDDYPTRKALSLGQPIRDHVLGIQYPDGAVRWLRITAVPEFLPGESRPYQVYSLLEDITERHNTKVTLEKSNRQMRLAQRISHMGSWEWDLQANQLVCSEELYRIIGRSLDQPITLDNCLDVVHLDDKTAMQQALALSARDGSPISQKLRIFRSDNSLRWLHIQGETVRRDTDGHPWLLVGITRDITEEHDLLTARENLTSLLAQTHEGIFRSTPQGRYQMANPAFARMFGYDSAEELITTVSSTREQLFVDPTRRDQFQAMMRETGVVSDFEAHVRRKDGTTFWINSHTRAVRDTHGAIIAYEGVVEDITDRKALQSERESQQRADHDPLTGLLSHAAFHKHLATTIAHARRPATSFGLVRLDIDNFTYFNDTYGHQVGDDVLRLVARRLQEITRPIDTVARYIGDEFALLLPDLPHSDLVALEAQLCSNLSGLTFHVSAQETYVPITLSLGIATMNYADTGPNDLLVRAGERLRAMKTGARRESEATLLRNVLHNQVEGFSMLDALVTAIDNKDRYTRRHSEEVMNYSLHLAENRGLGAAFQHTLAVAALLHDVGKIGVPDAVLRKPSHLTEAEFAAVRQHPEMGCAIVAAIPGLAETLDAIRHHHEQWNGKGYPAGLSGENIPLIARIMAVADAYSAMTSDRPYRAGLSPTVAQARLRAGSGTQWDPILIDAFLTPPP